MMGITFSTIVYFKAREADLDTMRGKFFMMGVPIGIILGLAVMLESSLLHILFRLLMVAALIFMITNLRLKLRAPLKESHLTIVAIFGIFIFIMMAAIIHQAPLKDWFTITIAFIDAISLILIMLNLLIYSEGEIAREWLFRTISIMILIIGDIAFLLYLAGKVGFRIEILLWFMPFFVMSNVLLYME